MNTIERAAIAVSAALRPLLAPLDSLAPGPRIQALAADLGWLLPDPVPPALIALRNAVVSLVQQVDRFEAARASGASDAAVSEAAAQCAAALAAAMQVFGAVPAALSAQLPPAFTAATGFSDRFIPRLLETLIADRVQRRLPMTGSLLALIGLIEISERSADPAHFQPDFTLRRVHWARIAKLLADPTQIFRDMYGWGAADLDLQPLHDALFELSLALGFPGLFDYPSKGLLKTVAPAVANPTTISSRILELVLLDIGIAKIAAAVTSIPKANPTALEGLAIAVTTTGALDKLEVPVGPNLTLKFDVALDASAGVALALRPGEAPTLHANYDGPSTPLNNGHLTAQLASVRPEGKDPFSLLAFPGGSRIEARELYLTGGMGRTKAGELDPFVGIGLKRGRLRISLAQADGFLGSLFPKDGLTLDFDVEVGWSRKLGIYLRGCAGLEISIPLHLSIGPVTLDSLFLRLDLAGGALALETSITAKGALGPLTAVVERIGLTAVTTFPAAGGNIGPANLALAFKQPNGVGLSVDAGVIKGGGYLSFDAERGEYAGALELDFVGIVALKAIGIITTKMPDGSPGFSLLIIITAEFGVGIQLGFGFTLLAVGGLLGLSRTVRLEPLMQGIRTGAVNNIMFPKDVIGNAPRIISDLRSIFPPENGKFLIGPMAKLGWGTPTLVSLSLGIIVEIPGNVAILGVLKIALPTEDAAIIILQVAFAGAIEFDKKRLYFFAAIFESRVVFCAIEGEMGVLAAFGDDANFVLSVGGFHPRFNPPPLPFPSPRRVSIDLVNNPLQRVRVEGYFAVTSNSAQFGARAEMFYGIDAFNISGHIAFDALLQFSPFFFIVEISASFAVEVFGAGLFSVRVSLSLEGPTPYRASGTGEISILFFEFSVDFSVSWGESRNTALPPIAVMPLFTSELEKPQNWRALLPARNNLLVSLRQLPEEETALVLHPVGVLRVSQRALPLGLLLDKVGNQKPSDVNRLSLKVTTGGLGKKGDAFEQFAPAQFQEMDDAQKLSQQAYGPQPGGVELSVAGRQLASSRMVRRVVRYEEITIDTGFRRHLNRFIGFTGALFNLFLRGAAISRSPLSQHEKTKLEPFVEKIVIETEKWTVAQQSTNRAFSSEAASFTSEASARDYLSRQIAANPYLAETLHVIPECEKAA